MDARGHAAQTLAVTRAEASACTRCDLYRDATQTVFGTGSVPAPLMLVGEQPGDREDIEGLPFVGPAGRVLERAVRAAGLDGTPTYVTNAVKHFRFAERGKRRIHQKPTMQHVRACRPWLEAELASVDPVVVMCLGATAAAALFGRAVTIGDERGKPIALRGRHAVVTVHPSSVLRRRDAEARAAAEAALVVDLVVARDLLGAS